MKKYIEKKDENLAKFGLIYDNEKSIELFKNKPINQLRMIPVKELDNINSLNWLFIIPTKDITKEECEKLKQNPALKIIIASQRYDYLNQISNSYIEQELNQKDIYNSIKQIIQTMGPGITGFDFMDIKKIFEDNTVMKIYEFLVKIHNNSFSTISSLVKKTVMNNIFKNNQCNCFLTFEGGEDLALNHIRSILSVLEAGLGDESRVFYSACIKKELKSKIKLNIVIGKKSLQKR